MTTVAPELSTRLERHILATPDDCECGMCTPTWMRRRGKSRRYSEPVSLAEALEREDGAVRPDMVTCHLAVLAAMGLEATGIMKTHPPRRFGAPEIGLPVLLFAAELAAAVQQSAFRDEMPDALVEACDQTIGTATIIAAESLAGLVSAFQAAAAVAG